MKEHPILFSTLMVRAILEGRKTQTRRIVKPQPEVDEDSGYVYWRDQQLDCHIFPMNMRSKWRPGDVLWVRETWQHTKFLNINTEDENYGYVYKADGQPWDNYEGWTWKPSIFMSREACRIHLNVEEVRVERLQDISEQDAIAEGVDSWIDERLKSKPRHYKLYYHDPGDESAYSSCPILSYESLWKSINGPASWDLNPWVWVIKFSHI